MKLVSLAHPALWTPAAPVTDFAPIDGVTNEMVKLAIRSNGAGLAAPQVGLSIRLCVIRTDAGWLICANPTILSHGRDTSIEREGCLSFPERLPIEVERWRVISVEYADEMGRIKRKVLKGEVARIAQHEIDHLSGTTIYPRPTDSR